MSPNDLEDRIISVMVLEPSSEAANTLAAALAESQYCEVLKVQTPQEAVQLVVQSQPCLVITSFIDQQTIMNSMVFLKGIHGLTKRGRVKSVVVAAIKSQKLRTAAQKLMVSEFMEEPVPARTIQFKANIQIKAVDAIKKKDAEAKAREEKIQLKQGEMAKAKADYDSQAAMKPRLGVKEDAFTFKGSQVKKKNNNTSFNLGGPDPASGDWVQHESEEEGKSAWRWVPNDEEEKKEAGGKDGKDGWIAEGEKPTFNQAKKKWEFAAEKPRVYLRKEGEVAAEKVRTNEKGELEVAEDSEEAEAKVEKSLKSMKDRQEGGAKRNQLKQKPKGEEEDSKGKDQKVKNKPDDKKDRLAALLDDDDEEEDPDKKHGDLGTITASKNAKEAKKSGFGLDDQLAEREDDSEKGLINDKRDDAEDSENTDKKGKEKLKVKPQSLRDRLLDDEDENADEDEVSAGELKDKRKPSDADDQIGLKDKRNDSEDSDDSVEKGNKKFKPTRKKLKDELGDSEEEETEEETVSAGDLIDKRKKDELEDKVAEMRNRLSEGDDDDAEPESHEDLRTLGATKSKEIKKSGFDVAEQIGKSAEDLKKKKLAELKKKLVDEAKREAAKPVKDKLPQEEREEMEKELGVKPGELDDKALGTKHKKEKLKKLMDKMKGLDDLDISLDEDEQKGSFNVHDLKKEESESTQSQKSIGADEERKGWGAHDSDQEDPEVEWKGHKSEGGKTDTSLKTKASDKDAYYVPEKELGIEGAAWEHSENYFICIGAKTKYRGFKSIEELIPVWIYGGKEKPEFLDKDKRWRFYDEPAKKIENIADLPIEVKDFLDALNEQLQTGVATNPRLQEKDEALREVEAKKEEAEERLKALKASLEADPEPTPEEAGAVDFDLQQFKEQKKEQFTKEHNEVEAELAALQEDHDQKKKDFVEEFEGFQKEEKTEIQSTAAQLEKKVNSDEAAEFLRKRKVRKRKTDENGEPIGNLQQAKAMEREKQLATATTTPKCEIGETIAIDLLLSDAIFDGKDIIEDPQTLLKTISERFSNTETLLVSASSDTGGSILSSSENRGQAGEDWEFMETPAEPEKEFITEKIFATDDQSLLGFLHIRPLAPRRSFTEDDVRILKLIAVSVANYWTSQNRREKKDEAA